MKKIIGYFIEKSLVVNLFTVIIFIFGIISVFTLQKEIFPSVDFDVILVSTSYPGSTSEDVEKLVTIPIERKLKSVSGIDDINALSLEGVSIVYLQLDPDYDIDDVLKDVKNEVDTVDDLPEDVKQPQIKSLNNKTRGVIKIALTNVDYNELRIVSKRLRDRLEQSKDIAFVSLDGYHVDEIRIGVDPDKLKTFDLTMSEVAKSISDRNLDLSSGKIKAQGREIFVRVISEFTSLEDIKGVVIRSNASGKKVKVGDIAELVRSPSEEAILQRSQGKEAIFLDVKIKENSDIIKSIDFIKKETKKFFEKRNNNAVEYRYVDDLSYYVKRRLNILKENGILGIVLVFFCLLAFLNFSTSVVTSLGAPIAFMISFVLMTYFGISINLISMFALILVLGMLVDDSIIVSEQFYQKLEKGMNPKDAAREAAFETIKPVSATIATTIIAFGALFFMGGIMGKFLWAVPVVVIICLLASLFECFFILPSHLADFCRIKKPRENTTHWYDKVKDLYKKVLSRFLNYPFLVVLAFVVVFISSLIMAKSMKFELFPGDDVRIVYFQVKGKIGTSINITSEAVAKVENLILKELKKNELDQITASIGTLKEQRRSKTGSHYGSVVIYLTPPDERERTTDAIIDDLNLKASKLIDGFEITVTKVQGGPPKGKPVDIEIKGDDLKQILTIAEVIKAKLEKTSGVISSEIDFEKGGDQVVAQFDEGEIKRLGLTTRQIALELRRALAGDSITEIRDGDEDIELKILLDSKSRKELRSLDKLFVLNNTGRRVPLKNILNYKENEGTFVIRRFNGKRIISVSGLLEKTKVSPVKIAKDMKPFIDELMEKNDGIYIEFGGENKNTKDSMRELFKSFSIAIICIFLVLVLMFNSLTQPLIIMSAIPLGLIGVVLAFKIFGLALGFMALMGVVGLIGVVVNDSIVLVNFINIKLQEATLSAKEAVMEASASRFRPVILTTFTTVAGLLPVAHTPGGDPFLKPMAYSFAYGLLFASLVTLIFIPSGYLVVVKIQRFVNGKINQMREASVRVVESDHN